MTTLEALVEATPAPPDRLPRPHTEGLRLPSQIRRDGGAELLCDSDFGQWGLRLLTDAEGRARALSTSHDLNARDRVVGEFLGDSDLLVQQSDGRATVASVLDQRDAWPVVADDLDAAIWRWFALLGRKYWEPHTAAQLLQDLESAPNGPLLLHSPNVASITVANPSSEVRIHGTWSSEGKGCRLASNEEQFLTAARAAVAPHVRTG